MFIFLLVSYGDCRIYYELIGFLEKIGLMIIRLLDY